MREGMEPNHGEGYGLLPDYLQKFDMAGIDVNDASRTRGLANQKQARGSPQVQWWSDCLEDGQIMGGNFAGQWPKRVATSRLQEALHRYAKDRGVRSWMPIKQVFNKVMAKIMLCWGSTKTTEGTGSRGEAIRFYVMPSLAAGRAADGCLPWKL